MSRPPDKPVHEWIQTELDAYARSEHRKDVLAKSIGIPVAILAVVFVLVEILARL